MDILAKKILVVERFDQTQTVQCISLLIVWLRVGTAHIFDVHRRGYSAKRPSFDADAKPITYVTVEYLLSINFSSLPLEKKIEIKKEGRPMPNLNVIQIKKTKSREFKRSFNNNVYSKHNWLCGCSKTNRLFCFPCILFCRTSGDKNW